LRHCVRAVAGHWNRIERSGIIFGAMASAIPVLINRSGGTAAAMGESLPSVIREAFALTGREIELELLSGAEIAEAARRHAGQPLVVVGGGDGTIGAAASALAHTSSALAVLPLGTRNHFARQLGLPLDLHGAAQLAVNGQRRRIDIGAAGDRVFINNASFGIYTRFVRLRDSRRLPKWLGTFPAMWHVLRRMRAQRFSLLIDGKARDVVTPLLFVGNNEYSIALGHLGERESLEDGRLSVCAVAAQSAVDLLAFAARALVGLAAPERDFEEFAHARNMIIDGAGYIEGAFDGELALMRMPLRLRSMPAALGVVTPRETLLDGSAILASESRIP
jgi:diacylglycerol kinase family enzyme